MATIAAAEYDGPVYIRFGRPAVPNFTEENKPFVIGKAEVMREGTDVTLFATGHLVFPALQAADMLATQGISAEVINIATIKPLDVETVLNSVRKTGCAVTAEVPTTLQSGNHTVSTNVTLVNNVKNGLEGCNMPTIELNDGNVSLDSLLGDVNCDSEVNEADVREVVTLKFRIRHKSPATAIWTCKSSGIG